MRLTGTAHRDEPAIFFVNEAAAARPCNSEAGMRHGRPAARLAEALGGGTDAMLSSVK